MGKSRQKLVLFLSAVLIAGIGFSSSPLFAVDLYRIPLLHRLVAACSGFHHFANIAIPPPLKNRWEDELDLYANAGTYPPPLAHSLRYNPYTYQLLLHAFPFMRDGQRVLILGGGSGYEAAVLAHRFPNSTFDVTDITASALKSLRVNIRRHAFMKNVLPFESNLFERISAKYDLILFAAPRPLTWYTALAGFGSTRASEIFSAESSRNNFDPDGKIHERLLNDFPKFLRAEGAMVILSDADYPAVEHLGFQRQVLFKAPWGEEHIKEDYIVLAYKEIESHHDE